MKPYILKTVLNLHFLTLFLGLCHVSDAQTLDSIELKIVFNVEWNEETGNAAELGASSTSDTWVTRVILRGAAIDTTVCEQGDCPAAPGTQSANDSPVSFTVQSTTEPDEDNLALRFHTLRSFDKFTLASNQNNDSVESLQFTDVLTGYYEPENGNRLETWALERSFTAQDLAALNVEVSSQGIVDYLTRPDTNMSVEEIFINQIQRKAYRKKGLATVANVAVVTSENNPFPAICRYLITSEWASGFAGSVFINNLSDEAIVDWRVRIQFRDFVGIDTFWSASVRGIIPNYVADGAGWTEEILPGQEVNFGFVGTKAAGQSADGTLEGMICR